MIELWNWEVPDPRTGRWRRTRYRMTESDARQQFGADARKIESTREVRDGDPSANSAGSFQRNRKSAGSSPGFSRAKAPHSGP